MLPQKLIIEGLYSYQKRQEIDFTVLNDAGLFGIFGIVGSGKSAILEAISLALYGETERLGQKDRNYSLMNLKSNLLYLEFEFIAGKNQEKLYKFTVKSKRNSKNFAEVRSLDRNAYLKQGNEWIPLKDKTAETIIGLSYDNFKRTVIIPQGKFQEFLQLKPTERTKMLKEIFYLSKYDLFDRCSGLIKENAGNLSENQGGLKALAQNLTPETLVNKEKELKEFLIKIEVQEKPLKVMEQKEKTFATLKENTDNANILKQEIKILENEKEKFKQKEKSLTDYEICKQNFQDVLVQENNLQLKKRNLNQELKTKTESFIKKQHFLTKQQEDHKKTKAIYQKKDVLEKKITEIPLLKNIMIKQQELIKKEQKLLQVNKEVNSLKEKLDLQTVQIKEQTTLLKNKKNKQLDPEKLIKVQNLFAEQKNLTVRIKENQEKSTEFSKEITKTEIQLGNILGQKIDFNKNQAMVLKKINLLIRQKETNLKNDKKQLEEWALQEKLSEFTTKIKENIPCPLCGSKEHPQILKIDAGETLLGKQTRLKEQVVAGEKSLNSARQVWGKRNDQLNYLEKETANLEKLKTVLIRQNELLKHLTENPEQEIANFKILDTAIKELENKLEKSRQVHEDTKPKYDLLLKESAGKIKEEITKLTTMIETETKQIKYLEKEKYLKAAPQELERLYQENKEKLANIISLFERQTKDIELLNKGIHNLDGSVRILNQNLEQLTMEEKQLANLITQRLAKTKFSLDEVKHTLALNLNILKEKAVLETYKNMVITKKAALKNLQAKTQDQVYDKEVHTCLQKELQNLQNMLKNWHETKGALLLEIKKMGMDLKSKQKLLNVQEQLEKRSQNLEILKRLFQANGFVNFISTKYLQNLCLAANERFYKLTQNALQLELTEDNNFQIRDFLHNGKTRHIKTLSGGQMFQASLAMALALSDSIQKQAGLDQMFFFLDEGFGTLDKETLQTVFEALKNLRQENKIVGIISHVDELKEDIDVFLSIANNSETGSSIRKSWR